MTDQQFTIEELNSEEWRTIPGFDSYKVSNLGRVQGIRVPLLKPIPMSNGYLSVAIGNPQSPQMIHRLVMAAFVRPVTGRMIQVNHKDGVKTNNRLANLEYVTAQENTCHAIKNRLRAEFPVVKRRARGATHYSRTRPDAVPRGSKHGRAKITEDMVIEIRQIYAEMRSYAKVAARFDLGKTTVLHIIKGDTWKHVL